MNQADLTWRLEEGYSRFLEGSRVELRLVQGPLRERLDVSPVGLARRTRPVELEFRAVRGFRGGDPAGFGWRADPGTLVRCRIFFPRNAFLGNFRVPQDHYAVQWDVVSEVDGAAGRSTRLPLLSLEAGTRLLQAWVEIFPGKTVVTEALRAAWRHYRNPLDPASISAIGDRQVVRWTWTGRVKLNLAVEWGLAAGWSIPGPLPSALLRGSFEAGTGLKANLGLTREGRFHLQVSRRQGGVRFSLRRTRDRTVSGGVWAGTVVRNSLGIRSLGPLTPESLNFLVEPLSEPLLRSVNREVRRALVRRLEVSLAVEAARSRGKADVVRAEWIRPDGEAFEQDYRKLLRGEFPAPRKGLTLSGTIEKIRSRKFEIHLNFLNWLRLRHSVEKSSRRAVTATPEGDIVFEESVELQRSRQRWGELQFLRILYLETQRGGAVSREFRWSHTREGKFSQPALRELLRLWLRSGVIRRFELPGLEAFPMRVRLLVMSRFTPLGLQAVREADPPQLWRTLIRSFELTYPKEYCPGSFRRDWIDHPPVRSTIDLDPVKAHLSTRYPLRGRSDFQRQQVVTAYLKMKRFLRLILLWRRQEPEEIVRLFQLGMDVPVSVLFHLLCPPQERRSAAILSGDWERTWGDPELLTEEWGGSEE